MRIIETQGIMIREESPAEQQELEQMQSYDPGQEDDSLYPGEYNVWVCYGPSPCNLCLENADTGPVKAGDPFPSGDTAPPAHDRCGCGLEAADPGVWIPPFRRKGERAIDYGTRQGK